MSTSSSHPRESRDVLPRISVRNDEPSESDAGVWGQGIGPRIPSVMEDLTERVQDLLRRLPTARSETQARASGPGSLVDDIIQCRSISAREARSVTAKDLRVRTTRLDLPSRLDADAKNRRLSAALDDIEQSIREVANIPIKDNQYLVSELDQIFCGIMRTAELAQGRMRVLLMQMAAWNAAALKADLPPQICEAFANVRRLTQTRGGKITPPSEITITTAEKLVLSLLTAMPKLDISVLHLMPRGHGAVAVSWGTTLRWLVEPARLPWPGVNVTAVSIDRKMAVSTDYYHFAGSVISHAVKTLRPEDL